MAELTPAQLKQLESIINSSVLSGSGDVNSGGYAAGVNNPAAMGTSLTSRSVPTFDVNEYGSPIIAQAKSTGAAILPNQPDGSVITGKSEAKLPSDPWSKVTGVDRVAKDYVAKPRFTNSPSAPPPLTPEERMAAKYGIRLDSSNPTRMEDQLLLSEYLARRNKNPRFASGMQKRPGVDDGLVYADGVEDPWGPNTRGAKGRVDAKVAARAAPTFRGSSFGGGFLGSILSGLLGKGGVAAPAAAPMGLSIGSSGGGGGSHAPVTSTNEQESKFQWTENTGLPKSVSSDPRWW